MQISRVHVEAAGEVVVRDLFGRDTGGISES
jgi:hypothetical protein